MPKGPEFFFGALRAPILNPPWGKSLIRPWSDLQKLNIEDLKKVEHPTYKSWTSDLQKLDIRPTKLCSTDQYYYQNISDQQKFNIWPTIFEPPTNSSVNPNIRPTLSYVQRTNENYYQNIRPTKLCSTNQRILLWDHPRSWTSDLHSYIFISPTVGWMNNIFTKIAFNGC